MNIQVKVIAGAKKNFIKKEGESFKVYLTAPAVEGKANKALIGFLAENFQVKKNQIQIIKGLKSRDKIINIE
ncbi:MAG: DUF167 domain-containing protein [Candidatus Omnitrophota bacterium]